MRDGKLLAMDSPSELKRHALPGLAWDVFAQPLLPALTALEKYPGILRTGLSGDHLRAITPNDMQSSMIRRCLTDAGIRVEHLETVEPTLEDVFLALADTNLTPVPGNQQDK
jgi:ABC-2 type transport system ATP-binding protein